jgi:hypothetical protein
MTFEVGDRVVAEAESTERRPRAGTVREVVRESPARYRIEWDDGHESIYTPAPRLRRPRRYTTAEQAGALGFTPEWPMPTSTEYPNRSGPEPSGPRYSARVALTCQHGHAPGQVLHAVQELRSRIDDRLRSDLGDRYDRHSSQSVGTDKLTVTFTLRAASHADAIRSAGLAAGTLAELLTDHAAAVDLSGIALVVRAE